MIAGGDQVEFKALPLSTKHPKLSRRLNSKSQRKLKGRTTTLEPEIDDATKKGEGFS